MAVTLLDSKIISGCVIFIVTLVCGVVPYLLVRCLASGSISNTSRSRVDAHLNSLQAFASGIFIGTCLLHLFPEAGEAIEESITSDLPVSEMIVAFGFLLLLVVENVILACHEKGGCDEAKSKKRNRREDTESVVIFRKQPADNGRHSFPSSRERRSVSKETSAEAYKNYGTVGKGYYSNPVSSQEDEKDSPPDDLMRNENDPLLVDDEDGVSISSDFTKNNRNRSEKSNGRSHNLADPQNPKENLGHGHDEDDHDGDSHKRMAVLKSFVLLLALSLHTVFDGLVVGLQTEKAEVWTVLAAVSIHKGLISVSIALSLLESHRHHPRASVLYLVLFSLVAPGGLAIGVVLTETDFDEQAQTMASGILQSVATGTFMYVTFVESLKGRFPSGSRRILNVLLVLVGFGVMCAFKVLLPG